MSISINNNLIVIENGHLQSYMLDDKLEWVVGRCSKDNKPDIELHSTTVSRKHGRFVNEQGFWFYLDNHSKNGTIHNKKMTGKRNRIRPIPLEDEDTFIFGAGNTEVFNSKTIWALYLKKTSDDEWRVIDTNGYEKIMFEEGDKEIEVSELEKGKVIRSKEGIAIYMGDITFLKGNIKVKGN